MPEAEEKKSTQDEITAAAELVKHLAICLRNVKGYPPGHPFVQKTLRETFGLVRDALGAMDELAVCIFENQVMVEDVRVDSSTLPAVIGLVDALKKVDVRSINFYQGFKLEELEALFSVLSLDKLSMREGGGAVDLLKGKGAVGVRLNEVEFGIISKRERAKDVKKVVLSLEAFNKLLATPQDLVAQASDAPGDVANMLAGVGGEDLSSADRIVMNVAKVLTSLSESYGEDERTEFASRLADFVTEIQPDLRRKVGETKEFDEKLAKVIRKALEDLSDAELVNAVLAKSGEVKSHPEQNFKGEMSGFVGSLNLEPDRKSAVYPEIKERLMSEGVPEDDILAILAEEDRKTFDMLLRDPQWMMKEMSRDPQSVAEAVAGAGGEDVDEIDRVVGNVETALGSLSQLRGTGEKSEYTKRLAQFARTVAPAVRDKVGEKEEFDGRVAGLLKTAFGSVSDDELAESVIARLMEGKDLPKEELEDDLRRFFRGLVLDQERRTSIHSRLTHRLSELQVPGGAVVSLIADEELKEFLPEGTAPLREAVVLDRGALDGLKEKIRQSVEVKDLEGLLKPVFKTLEDKSPAVRKSGVGSLGEILEGLLASGEPRVAEKLVGMLRKKMDVEQSFEVYLAYVSILEKIATAMRARGREDIAEEIQATFTQHISEEGKRKRAVEALGKVGGTDALISLLSALWESGIYKEVRDAIVQMGKEAMPLVIEIFGEAEDRLLRRRIMDLLINVGEDAIDAVTQVLDDERWHVRRDAATVLSKIGGKRALTPLVTLLSDRELSVRKGAAEGIAMIGGEEAEGHLLDVLEKGDPRLRSDILRMLGKTGGQACVPRLLALLLKEGKPDEERVEILRALGQIGSDSAVDTLRKVIEETVLLGRPKYSDEVRVGAVHALARTAGAEMRHYLERVSARDRSRPVQIAAASAIRRLDAQS